MSDGEQLWQNDDGLYLVTGDKAFHLGDDACDWLTSLRAHRRNKLGWSSKSILADMVTRKRGARRVR